MKLFRLLPRGLSASSLPSCTALRPALPAWLLMLAVLVLPLIQPIFAAEVLSPALPASVPSGTAITPIGFSVVGGTTTYRSWEVASGSVFAPGLSFGAAGTTTGRLTVPGIINTTQPTLSGTPTTPGTYTLRLVAWELTNAGGLSSATFTFTVTVTNPTAAVPVITLQPQSQAVTGGSRVSFTVAATNALSYQWRKNGVAISAAVQPTLTLTNVDLADAGVYTVVVTNAAGSVTSSSATLSVFGAAPQPPVITVNPQSVSVRTGTTLALTASATNVVSYQWRRSGTFITGASTNTLVLTNVTVADAGNYTVDALNANDTVTSTIATVNVLAATTGDSKLSNISVRTNLPAAQTLTVGYVTNGTKKLLLRAVGPTLAPVFNITNFYPDPALRVLNQSQTVLGANDNWNGDAQVTATASALGAFPLASATSKDAALVLTTVGPAIAEVSGTGPGILLTEVYDADAPSAGASLTNVSARNKIGTGSDVLVSGFVIAGPVAKTVLIRGIGPALKDVFGVTGNLVDPKLEVFTQDGAKVAENDDWGTTVSPFFSSVGAYPFTANSKDSALMITLPPGVYTAQVSGVNGTTGDGVVEVYVLP